jgi:RHS repeat-associated protein
VLAVVSSEKNSDGTANVVSASDYYPFGMGMPNRTLSGDYRFGYNGMEKDDELKGVGNSYDFGNRLQDPRTGRWLSLDKAAKEYPYLSSYAYCNNNPIIYIDPDGKRFYFAAGAANDPDKTGYPKMMLNAFETEGIQNTVQISAHSNNRYVDVLFTMSDYSRQSANNLFDYVPTKYQRDEFGVSTPTEFAKKQREIDWRITKAVDDIKADLKKNPLAKGEQFNLSGYSTGSVTMAQAALQLANEGKVIDNLVLIGTSISEDSQLWKDLQNNANIKNIIRKDIEGDDMGNINDGNNLNLWGIIKAGFNFGIKSDEEHPHFNYAFGEDAEGNSQELGKELINEGVK